MTIEEIRKARIEAEAQILAILSALREKTELCPMDVDVGVVAINRFGSPYEDSRPTSVRITFQPV